MKYLTTVLMAFVPCLIAAQDVIVKKDGSTILAKVLEINPTDIKYKKHSNQDGPTYTILKAEVLSINYEGGDKDIFTDSKPAEQTAPNGGFGVNPNLEAENLALVRQFNQRELPYTGSSNKSANDFICILGMKEGSIVETPELKADFSMKRYVSKYDDEFKVIELGEKSNFGINRLTYEEMVLVVTLTNKTNRAIYIDQASSFVLHYKVGSKPFYVPTASTTSTASTSGSGGGVGFGIGGIGISLGGGSSSTQSSSTTTYSQRIVTIPPMGTMSLEPQHLGESYRQLGNNQKVYESLAVKCYVPYFIQQGWVVEKDKYYSIDFGKLKMGETIDIPILENLPFSVHLTYSFDEQQKTTQSMRQDFYVRQLVGADEAGSGDRIDLSTFDLSQNPLLYLIRGKKLKK